jgi:hypothetical protein
LYRLEEFRLVITEVATEGGKAGGARGGEVDARGEAVPVKGEAVDS